MAKEMIIVHAETTYMVSQPDGQDSTDLYRDLLFTPGVNYLEVMQYYNQDQLNPDQLPGWYYEFSVYREMVEPLLYEYQFSGHESVDGVNTYSRAGIYDVIADLRNAIESYYLAAEITVIHVRQKTGTSWDVVIYISSEGIAYEDSGKGANLYHITVQKIDHQSV